MSRGVRMKKVTIFVFILLLMASQAFAMSPVNTLVIQAAQEYGRRLALDNFIEFMAPWTAFEEKSQKLNSATEHAYIFTPYLLVAANARETVLRGQPLLLENSEKALAQYDGYLVFSVTIHTQDPSTLAKITANLVQEKQNISSFYMTPSTKNQTVINGKLVTSAQYYFYFSDKTVLRNKPAVLTLTDASKHKRGFFFDLDKIL